MIDLHIRNVEPMAVKKLDEIARKKGLNRSEFIREMISDLSVIEMRGNLVDRLEKQIEANNILMEHTTRTLDDVVSLIRELMDDE